MTDGVDGVAEDEVFDTAVSVCTHDQQIRLNFTRVTHDFLAWIRPVPAVWTSTSSRK